ncbi:hypothetical protein AMR42_07875 [Limnothrix sp. PR1529]|nr:hypothetical protein BCR12_06830 [Limnothrix sp. P13C2]PIB13990.1 hypothetical protein AMR42_07875 [Limnothrix sp. PR1529]
MTIFRRERRLWRTWLWRVWSLWLSLEHTSSMIIEQLFMENLGTAQDQTKLYQIFKLINWA